MIDEYLFYSSEQVKLYLGDSLELLKDIPQKSVDMIFADPPYFLSNDGITCSSGHMVSVNKGDWDKRENIKQIHEFNVRWLDLCRNILKPNGTIWVSGTYHNIFSVGLAMQELDYRILNNITWVKLNPPPNLSCRFFTHSTETIIWASKDKKSKHLFDYALMKEINSGKQMKDVWEIPAINVKEKKFGKHPTQKPVKLLERIIASSTKEGDTILDPFNGSGTTGFVAVDNKRNYIGIDISSEYLEITKKRIISLNRDKLNLEEDYEID
jgi:site-specific DNA-methyltransferase (adenine-specific)